MSLCDYARAHCPRFPPRVAHFHWPVFDPILAEGSADERLAVFREVRDEIRERIERARREGDFDRLQGPSSREP